MSMSVPIITLTTDFGLSDHYVAAMKAAILASCPQARLIDVTHDIAPGDVAAGSFVLERAVAAFGPGTVHMAVVDPGVGTQRPLMLVETEGQFIVCPDNGLITWTWYRHACVGRVLTWRPAHASATFHGRDILAPAAAMLAGGTPVDRLAAAPLDPILLDAMPITAREVGEGRIIYIDRFGNCTTNVLADGLGSCAAEVGGRALGSIRHTYGDVAPGEPLALIGSSDLLEIAVRDGSAAAMLKLKVGDIVRITDAPKGSP